MSAINGPQFIYIQYIYIYFFLINISVASWPIPGTTLASSRLFCQISTPAHVWKFPSIYLVWSGLNWTCSSLPQPVRAPWTGRDWNGHDVGLAVVLAKPSGCQWKWILQRRMSGRLSKRGTRQGARLTLSHTHAHAHTRAHARTDAWL